MTRPAERWRSSFETAGFTPTPPCRPSSTGASPGRTPLVATSTFGSRGDIAQNGCVDTASVIQARHLSGRLAPLPLRVFRFSGRAFTQGVESIAVEGRHVRIYSLAKTIADLFKYRHKVGLDVAVEALRESIRSGKVKPGQIDPFARTCRVREVLRPYLEALVG